MRRVIGSRGWACVKDHGDGLAPTPASFRAKARKLVDIRVRETAHGLTLLRRVKDWSTCVAVLERGEACFNLRKNGARRRGSAESLTRSAAEGNAQIKKKLILIPHEFRSNG